MSNTNETEHRIFSAKKFLEVANRMETGEATYQEIVEAFRSAPARVIDEIEEEAKARGMPPLPAVLNPGSPEFRVAMDRYKEVHAMGDEATPQEVMLSFMEMYRLAPPWWKAEMDSLFDESFSISPDGYTESGEATFSVGAIARWSGRSESEVITVLRTLEEGGFQMAVTEKTYSIN